MSLLLPAAARAAVPWKNGGGVTRVIDSSPGLGSVEFGWRASMAEVSEAGAFSCFPGIARLLCVLRGTLELEVEGKLPVVLQPADAAYGFPGDAPAFGAPRDGDVLDFNLMFDPARFSATLTRHAGLTLPPGPASCLLLALEPLTANGLALQALDALRLPPETALQASGACWLACLTPKS
jgi:uncharacterized protein